VSDFLARIAAHKRAELPQREAARPLSLVQEAARAASPARDFEGALQGAPPRLIAEIKRVSPAKGALNPGLSPAHLARTYATAGAHCLSVLTDEEFFKGSDADLVEARAACSLPVLRKDFVVAPYQVYEARALGADAVLLIAALLVGDLLAELRALAASLGMAALVEVHAPGEVAAALAAGATLVGINNRNLATFQVDLAATETVRPLIPLGVTVVSESGIATAANVSRALAAGVQAILVGEALVTAPDPAVQIAELLGAVAWSR
jgi:indole-3-glycerol phosphate synthase